MYIIKKQHIVVCSLSLSPSLSLIMRISLSHYYYLLCMSKYAPMCEFTFEHPHTCTEMSIVWTDEVWDKICKYGHSLALEMSSFIPTQDVSTFMFIWLISFVLRANPVATVKLHLDQLVMGSNPEKSLCICKGKTVYNDPLP